MIVELLFSLSLFLAAILFFFFLSYFIFGALDLKGDKRRGAVLVTHDRTADPLTKEDVSERRRMDIKHSSCDSLSL